MIVIFKERGMIESIKESIKVLSSSTFFVIIAVLSILVLVLNNIEPFRNKIEHIGFVLFTILCLGMGIINRQSNLYSNCDTLWWVALPFYQRTVLLLIKMRGGHLK